MSANVSIWLSAEDRAELESWVADRNTPQKLVWRSRIVGPGRRPQPHQCKADLACARAEAPSHARVQVVERYAVCREGAGCRRRLPLPAGAVIGQCMKRHRHQEFLRFLRTLDRQTPKKRELHLVLDNYATHKHSNVKTWLAKHPRFHLHFTPTSASWLNQVERFFGLITQERIRRGVFTSVPELEAAIHEYLDHHNADPKPFVWTKSAEEILAKVTRARNALEPLASGNQALNPLH